MEKRDAVDPWRLFSRAQARAAGMSDRQVTRRLAAGRLTAVRRGVAIWPGDVGRGLSDLSPGRVSVPEDLDIELHLRAALLCSRGRELVASHVSGARLWELPRPVSGWPNPQFTTVTPPGRRRGDVHVRVAPLSDEDIVLHKGMLVTSPGRTVVDCLRSLPPADGLAILDSALRRRLTDPDSLLAFADRQQGWPGIVQARKVLELAEPLRESPLESWSAWAFNQIGAPDPLWQVNILDPKGGFAGRVDCWWPGVIGEADGRSKYALAAAEQGGGADAVYRVLQAERLREQRLRDLGADVLRWSAADVLDTRRWPKLADRLRNALARADQGAHFIGRLARPTPV